jgi:phosphopantothenoylcysteine decarboxylase/phosphopantothenate--cysteine ligase
MDSVSANSTKKRVLLVVSGSIACYRACEVISLLRDTCDTRVVMTPSATQFVTPLTFEALTGHPALWQQFGAEAAPYTVHIDLSRDNDLVLICPATANLLGKYALGLADDLASTVLLSLEAKPVLIAPAMNHRMWRNPAVVQNCQTLRDRGCEFIDPESGHLACGEVGEGRLASPEAIAAAVRKKLGV